MSNVNLQTQITPELVKEMDISCFLLENRETGLFITIQGAVKTTIFVNREYDFEVENNKILIENFNVDESTFELNMENFEFENYESYLEFTSKDKDLKINISEM